MSRGRRPAISVPVADDRAEALRLFPVSRETSERLDLLVERLLRWQRTINLIAPSTIPHVWMRHVADSLQLLAHAGPARIWLDIGSGAGFPGLVVACAMADRPDARVHLVESDLRKAAFLRETTRELKLPAIVHAERVESLHNGVPTTIGTVDVITARAVARLPVLLGYVAPWLEKGAKALFPKGREVEAELTEAAKDWTFAVARYPSVLDPGGQILCITRAERRIGGSSQPLTR